LAANESFHTDQSQVCNSHTSIKCTEMCIEFLRWSSTAYLRLLLWNFLPRYLDLLVHCCRLWRKAAQGAGHAHHLCDQIAWQSNTQAVSNIQAVFVVKELRRCAWMVSSENLCLHGQWNVVYSHYAEKERTSVIERIKAELDTWKEF